MDAPGEVDRARLDSPGDHPVRGLLRTNDVETAQRFCRGLFRPPLRGRTRGVFRDFSFDADLVRLGPVLVGHAMSTADFRIDSGGLESVYHVMVPLNGAAFARHRGVSSVAEPTRAAVFQPVGDVAVTVTGGSRMMGVTVSRDVLDRELAAIRARPSPMVSSFPIDTGPGRSWAALLRLLLTDLHVPDGLTGRPHQGRRWRDLVVRGLALTLDSTAGDTVVTTSARPVDRVLEAMHDDPARAFTAAELAGIAGTGLRVLQESFRRQVGVPPLSYLRRLRLDGVHADLVRADPRTTVSEVAYRWGFTHLGRFAGAYRQRYGESPSQTLRRRRD